MSFALLATMLTLAVSGMLLVSFAVRYELLPEAPKAFESRLMPTPTVPSVNEPAAVSVKVFDVASFDESDTVVVSATSLPVTEDDPTVIGFPVEAPSEYPSAVAKTFHVPAVTLSE